MLVLVLDKPYSDSPALSTYTAFVRLVSVTYRCSCSVNLQVKFDATASEDWLYNQCTLALRMVKFDATASEDWLYEW